MKEKQLVIEQLKELAKIESDYSFGEIIFTILRPKFLKQVGEDQIRNLQFLKDIKDTQFMTSLEKAIKESKKIKLIDEN